MLNFIENKKFIIFVILVVPILINSYEITQINNTNALVKEKKEELRNSEQKLLENEYLMNKSQNTADVKNIFSKDEIIGKTITFNFRQQTNNHLGDIIKFIYNDTYTALLHMPIGYQSYEKESLGLMTFDTFKDIEVDKESFQEISNGSLLGTKLFNIEGILVSQGNKFVNNKITKEYLCRLSIDTSWQNCSSEVIEKLKMRYSPREIIKQLLERTKTTEYTIHDIGTKLFYINLKGEGKSYLFRCQDQTPDGTEGENFQCINLLDNDRNVEKAESFLVDVLPDSTVLFSGSGDVFTVNNRLDINYLVNTDFITESNLYSFSELYLNTKLFGHYSSGSLRTYGMVDPFVEIFKPNNQNRPNNEREMTSFNHLNGNEFYGVYPWGELWLRDLEKRDILIELFENSNAGEYVFPFENDIKNFQTEIYNKTGYAFLAQKVSSIVPCFEGLCFSVSNKTQSGINENDYQFLSNKIPDTVQYGKIYYLKGDKQMCIYSDNFINKLTVEIYTEKLILKYQGKECILHHNNNFDKVELLSKNSIDLQHYIYIDENDS